METPLNEVPTPPELPQTENPTPQPPAKKRKKWLLPVIIGGGAAFLLVIAGIIAFFLLRSSNLPFKPDTSLIPVMNGDQWGYINKKGNYVINPQFSDATWFNNGLALVANEEGEYGFIDKKGNYKIPAQYSQATIFNEGLAFVVKEGGYPTCIDRNGNVEFEFTMAEGVGCFQEGLAPFYTLNNDNEAQWGFVDKKGNVVINPQFAYVHSFSNGLAAVANDKEKWGFINQEGTYVINPQFDNVGNFYKAGIAPFKSGDKWGYIDKKGKYVINPQFEAVSDFYENTAMVMQNDKCGFINTKGNFVINPQFENSSVFIYGEGLAAVAMDDKVGFIDEKGRYVINPQFDMAYEFCDGFAIVGSDEKYGLINKKGNYIVNPQFENIKMPYLDFSMVRSEYYDASKFLKSFLSNFSSSQVDGMPASSITLSDIASHEEYSASWKENLWSRSLRIKRNEEITDDITLNAVEFYFLSTTYSYDWWSYNTEYNADAACSHIAYEFDLDNKAASRSSSIASSLCNKLKSIYGGTVSNVESEYTYASVKKIECGNLNFIVLGSYSELWLYVYFDKDTYKEALHDITADDEPETEVTEPTDWETTDSTAAATEWDYMDSVGGDI